MFYTMKQIYIIWVNYSPRPKGGNYRPRNLNRYWKLSWLTVKMINSYIV